MYICSSVAKDGKGEKGVLARSNVKSGRQDFSPSESRACQPASALIEKGEKGQQRSSAVQFRSHQGRETESERASEQALARESRGLLHAAALRGQGSLRPRRTDCLVALARTPTTTLRFVRPTVRVSVSSKQPQRTKEGAAATTIRLSPFPKIAEEFLGECYF